MRYCVITLDLVSSRKIVDRSEVQHKLKDALQVINKKFAKVLQVPFAFTLGDEVQGVLSELPVSYEVIREFQRLLSKHPFYVGVGYGDIQTELSERSGEMDGPAFHFARASVDSVKKEYAKSGAEQHSRRFVPLIRYTFNREELSEMVNAYLHMLELLKFRLTEKQREVYWLLFQADTYSEIADQLAQSKSAITQKVQAGHVEEIRAGEQGLCKLLGWIEKIA